MSQAPYALDSNGLLHACCDGPELLTYEGNGSPRWKQFCDDIIVGVAVTDSAVITSEAAARS